MINTPENFNLDNACLSEDEFVDLESSMNLPENSSSL